MEGVNLEISYFSLILLVAFLFKQNVDEKICEVLTSESRKTRIAWDRMLIEHTGYADLMSSYDIIVKVPIEIFVDPAPKPPNN